MDYYNYGIPQVNPGYIPQQTGVSPQFQVPQQQNCPLDNRFVWTQSKEMARSTPMAPDKTILFLNENDSYAYLRKTDNTGRTVTFKTFRLEEEEEPDIIQAPNTISADPSLVTREEFERFSKNIDTSINELKEMLLANKQNYNKNYNNKQKVGDH